MREEGLPAVRETLSTLAGSDECMHEFVCGESFRLVPAEDKEDEYANFIETRRLSKAFNYAVEQSMLCYLDTAVGETDWCFFFLQGGQAGLESALNAMATCPLCE